MVEMKSDVSIVLPLYSLKGKLKKKLKKKLRSKKADNPDNGMGC